MGPEIENFLSIAQEAASGAGALILEHCRQPKQVDYKGAIDLVTSVDRESERRIVECLLKAFPSHSILAEEETHRVGADSSHRWIIDPLDGTTNFAHSYPQFCVSIALERDGEVILGLVYDPVRAEWFQAVKGHGATLNGAAIRISSVNELDKALLATGFPYDRRDNADSYLALFKAFMIRSQGIRRAGAAALDLCYVACGRLDGFWELKLHAWDTAAGALIVQEASGRMSDFRGGPFTIWGDETVASNSNIHEAMVDVLVDVLTGAGNASFPLTRR